MIVAEFHFPSLVVFLIWLVFAVMAFWIWSASKAKASLLTMIGAALVATGSFFVLIQVGPDPTWLGIIGFALVTLGYYQTVKPIVDKHLHDLKQKAIAKAASGSSTPPAAPPPPAKV